MTPNLRPRRMPALLSLLATAGLVSCVTTHQVMPPGVAFGATGLRCEDLVDPQGVGIATPRLSWRVASAGRGQRQTAYRVLVASAPDRLARGEGDLWDTGRVASDATRDLVYAGKPLASGRPCWWAVQVWDRDGKVSPWSKPATWSMGLLAASDWKAEWIGLDAVRGSRPDDDFGAAHWIVFAGDPANAPAGARFYSRTFDLPAAATAATLRVTADDKGVLFLNGERLLATASVVDSWKTSQHADVTAKLRPGPNRLAMRIENATPGPYGILFRLDITMADGKKLTIVSDTSWKASNKPAPKWESESNDGAWPAAKSAGAHGCKPWGVITSGEKLLPPPRLLRTAFTAAKPVKRAVVHTTALGIHDLHLNGTCVTEADFFNPGWTDYGKRVYTRTYDVTPLVKPGANAFGAVLADGWYSGHVGYGHRRDHYGTKLRLKAQLDIEYADGTTQIVATGPDWRASTGALREADFLMGEVCDAAKEPAGWNRPGFDDAAWAKVDTGAELNPVLQWHPGPPVRVVGVFPPRKWTEPKPGVWVADLGQNLAGVPRLTVKGRPGQRIQLRFAERLNPDGTIYTTNLRSARATDTYICRGGGEETWTPRYTFHGFQYVEVTGLDGKPAPDLIAGLALSSATPAAGRFECSDPMLSRLWTNTVWTQYANFIDIPTDCPQRDERLGWTGDAQAYIRAACMNNDVQAFFTKWLVDLEDAQRADGQFPMVAPLKVAGDDGGPAWADAGVICPWTIHDVYGDRRALERHYPAMVRFMDFCVKRSTPDLLPPEKFHCFGDWLHINAETPKDVIYTAYFAMSARLTAQAADVLGKADDAAKFRDLYGRVKAAFQKAYVAADGKIKGDSQTVYILAIVGDLVDGAQREQAAKHLVANIEARGSHLSTGFVGTRDIMHALSKIGRQDVAYRLLHNDTFPSWGFTIRHGATTIWERWDGWTPDKGFQTPGMNSFAHYAFGAVYQWMVENIGGIRNDAPGYRKIRIAPAIDPKLDWARVGYDSPAGPIFSSWRKAKSGAMAFDIEIPANTTATVVLPAASAASLTENGRPLSASPDVKVLREGGGTVELAIGSGRYTFIDAAR